MTSVMPSVAPSPQAPAPTPGPVPSVGAAVAGEIRRLALYGSVVVSFLAASAAPTPLYQHYNTVWHGTALTTTTAFASYAGAVLVGLLMLGELSNHVGRRPVLLAAIAAQALSVTLIATAGSFAPLFAARIIQGVATGAALGTLGASMIDIHRDRGTILNVAAPGIGSGVGALVAGLLVGYLPWPTHLVYLTLLVILVAQGVGIARQPETTPRAPGLVGSLRPQIAVPAPARAAFLAAAPVIFAAWALPGFYASLGPALTRDLAHSRSVALGGVALFLVAGLASVASVVLRDLTAGRMMTVGIATLAVGAVGSAGAIAAGSEAAYLVSTALAGVGFGASLQGGIRTVTPLASPEQRPGLLSAVFVVSYAGMGIPAVIAGYLVSRGHDLRQVAVGYVLALVLLAGAAAVSLARTSPRRG
ncbi:MFS transporter [Frankia sp. AgKG'84/4]|uniref:MFS transporter n=1 Tax=Frankia sp. AgKG'84/4 TaxID=573490 RepID=UPI00200C330E|nr:MFS transporter [Frankia sp. AgKG'84/4]MCL9794693.1 MFS transporter [Frankia sp. AgKG'84/4]